jgi:hypothetical protein
VVISSGRGQFRQHLQACCPGVPLQNKAPVIIGYFTQPRKCKISREWDRSRTGSPCTPRGNVRLRYTYWTYHPVCASGVSGP